MDFTLSKQQQMVQKMYKEFAENEVKPLAKKVDAEEYFPKAVSYTHLDVYKRQANTPSREGHAGGYGIHPYILCPRNGSM